ncbi:hypothetical protein [Xanthomonas oryzae]|uniref:hypothetical protein n=1 Tax=Xanthomonas oryzae TaxID=347 RepID=UPI0030FE44DB
MRQGGGAAILAWQRFGSAHGLQPVVARRLALAVLRQAERGHAIGLDHEHRVGNLGSGLRGRQIPLNRTVGLPCGKPRPRLAEPALHQQIARGRMPAGQGLCCVIARLTITADGSRIVLLLQPAAGEHHAQHHLLVAPAMPLCQCHRALDALGKLGSAAALKHQHEVTQQLAIRHRWPRTARLRCNFAPDIEHVHLRRNTVRARSVPIQ